MSAFRTMIVTASDAPLARQLAAAIDPNNSSDMWIIPLVGNTDHTTVTHYVSTGWVAETFADPLPLAEWVFENTDPTQPGTWVQTGYLPGNPGAVVAAAAALNPPLVVSIDDVSALFARSDVTMQDPWIAFQRLGIAPKGE